MADIDTWQDPHLITEVPRLPEGTLRLNLSDTRISVLDGALLPRSIQSISLTLSKITTVRNLHLLTNLQELDLSWTVWLDKFDTTFPPSLRSLTLNRCMYLRSLPPLTHTSLVFLDLHDCRALRVLPHLPYTLYTLALTGCDELLELPFLPDALGWLQPNVLFAFRGPPREGWADNTYATRYRERQRSRLQRERFELFHEELMQKAWHPDRVSKWLEQGEHVLDNIMGI